MDHHFVALVLSKNSDANRARNQIAGALRLEDYEIQDISNEAGTNNYNFFKSMLSRWKSRFGIGTATLQNLVAALEDLEMWDLASELAAGPRAPQNPGGTSTSSAGSLATHVFAKCSETIKKNLKSDSIIWTLFCKKVLSQAESEEIHDLKTVAKREMLIRTMMTKDKQNILKFIEVGKEETAGQDYIWNELEDAIIEFEAQAR